MWGGGFHVGIYPLFRRCGFGLGVEFGCGSVEADEVEELATHLGHLAVMLRQFRQILRERWSQGRIWWMELQ